MELKYFRGLQDRLTLKQGHIQDFRHANLLLAKNKTRHMLVADYVKTLQGSVVIVCPTNAMCEAVHELLPLGVCFFGSMSKAELDIAIDQYGRDGILLTSYVGLSYIAGLRNAHNLVFTSYTYFTMPFIHKIRSIGVMKFHQIVDNVNLRGVIPEAFRRMEACQHFELERYDDYEHYSNFK
jgi:hypothetical protein